MRLITEYWPKPIPDRSFDWSAIDGDTYDGADDSSNRSHVGYGRTKIDAIEDLLWHLDLEELPADAVIDLVQS